MKWHKGPPPSVGWWPAQVIGSSTIHLVGWWDGEWWSEFASPFMGKHTAAECASRRGMNGPDGVVWADRPKSWPARSKT